MIEKMKHVFIICRQQDRNSAVERLGDLGIVHVADVKPPQSDEIEQLRHEESQVEDAIRSIREYAENSHSSGQQAEAPPGSSQDGSMLTSRIIGLLDELEEAKANEVHWQGVRQRIEPWGGFSRALLLQLNHYQDLSVWLLEIPVKSELPGLPEEAWLKEVSRDKQNRRLILAAPSGEKLPEELPLFHLPEETDLNVIDKNILSAAKRMKEAVAQLRSESGAISALTEYLEIIREKLELAKARAGMGEARQLSYLQGYVPADQEAALKKAAKNNAWALLSKETEPDDTKVPTKIRLARWVEPIRVVFQTMGIMPGYREIDISAWFMLFLSIFFALLFGDAGYGALFLVLTIGLRKVFPAASARPFYLFGVFSVTTMVWGALTGTYFGIQENLGPLSQLRIGSLTDEDTIQKFCFFLGAVHLTVAHLWNALIYGRSLRTFSELAWVSILWGNFYLAQVLVLNIESPELMMPLYAVGLLGVLFFAKPSRNPLKLIGGGIGALLLGLVNSFVDVISYIRLYAVGAATVALASSFNSMAGEFFPAWSTFFIGVLILALGHSLNIVLGLMSVLVHGVRLNVLEFSQHLGMQWSGEPYSPLQRRKNMGGQPEEVQTAGQ